MQIILTKSNNIKFEKQIGHLVLFYLFFCWPLFRSSVCGSFVQRAWGHSTVRWSANIRWCAATDSASKVHMAEMAEEKGCSVRVRVCAARDEIIANNFHKFVILCFCGCCCRFGCFVFLCPDCVRCVDVYGFGHSVSFWSIFGIILLHTVPTASDWRWVNSNNVRARWQSEHTQKWSEQIDGHCCQKYSMTFCTIVEMTALTIERPM